MRAIKGFLGFLERQEGGEIQRGRGQSRDRLPLETEILQTGGGGGGKEEEEEKEVEEGDALPIGGW